MTLMPNQIVIDKFCGRCRRFLPRSDFYSSRSKSDGLKSWCQQCHRADMWARRHRNTARPDRQTRDLNRFLARVEFSESCWLWTGSLAPKGYGQFSVGGRGVRAHRWLYELVNGPVRAGLVLDHICHNDELNCAGGPSCPHRRCVNPDHLRVTTSKTNSRSGRLLKEAACRRGHARTTNNTTWRYKRGYSERECLDCKKVLNRQSG